MKEAEAHHCTVPAAFVALSAASCGGSLLWLLGKRGAETGLAHKYNVPATRVQTRWVF